MPTYLGVLGTDNEIRTVSDSNGYPVKGMGTNGEFSVTLSGSIAQWAVTGDSNANTALTITKAAVTGQIHYITGIEVVISAAAAANDISVELRSGSTVLWKEYIGNASPRGTRVGFQFSYPIALLAANTAANLVVGAGGASVVATANMAGYTK